MSLLLDALKRAEEAKRAKQAAEGENAGAQDRASVDPAAPDATPSAVRPIKPAPAELRLQDYPEDLPARAARAMAGGKAVETQSSPLLEEPSTRAPLGRLPTPAAESRQSFATGSSADTALPDERQRQETARNVFAAKQPMPEAGTRARSRWLPPVIAVIAVVVGGGGWYVWNEVNKVSRPQAGAFPGPTPLPPPAPAVSAAATGAASAPTGVDATLPPLLPPQPAVLTAAPAPASSSTATVRAVPRGDDESLAQSLRALPMPSAEPVSLKLTRAVETTPVDPRLARAYAALRSGNNAEAQRLYTALVQADPLSLDAQLGLAAAAARTGDTALAARHYREALGIDPRNDIALSGLLAIREPGGASNNPDALETELRTLLLRSPDAAALHFSLGNLYAAQKRWGEAQQSFFEAFRLDSETADHAYNLAVSLDQLGQSRLALDFYRRALTLLPRSGGQFDPNTATRRVEALAATAGTPR